MRVLIILIIISGLAFFTSLVTLVLGLTKKNKKLKLTALFAFLVFIGVIYWTGCMIINKTYYKVTDTFKMRTGDEIYNALFDKRKTDCIKIISYQDQVVPKIDYAIWLHFETCPKELERILSRHNFDGEKLPTDKWSGKIPFGETIEWFNPKSLGDTIMVYEFSTNDSRNIQTVWTNLDSTEVFVRDILD